MSADTEEVSHLGVAGEEEKRQMTKVVGGKPREMVSKWPQKTWSKEGVISFVKCGR